MLFSRRKTVLFAATGVAAVSALAGCGNPITASHDWRSLSALVTVTEQAGAHSVSAVVLAGPLIDASGKPVAKTAFEETCAVVKTTGSTTTPAYKCLALIYTGPKAYFAGGTAAGPYETLKSLAVPATSSSIKITRISGTQPAGKPVLIKISAIKG